jgi:ankyrin repeat protein
MIWCKLWFALGTLLVGQADTKLPPSATIQVDYKQHVQPILAANCYSCHGPRQQQSGLRLDKRQNALRGGDYGPVILPGKSAESRLIHRLVSGDGGLQMPPTGPLTAEEIGILRAWIDQGGEFADVELTEPPQKPVDPVLRDLLRAVRNQDGRRVREALQANPRIVTGQDSGGSTLLHHAAAFGTLATMRLLLEHGADPNAKNRLSSTPLHWAVQDEAKVRLLLSRGAHIDSKTYDGRTPLFLAASQPDNVAVLRLLLARGADPNAATMVGRTPLMGASLNGIVPSMKLLVEKQANVRAASSDGSVALIDAAVSRNPAAVRFLLDHGAEVNAKTKRGMTALCAAARDGVELSVKMLLDAEAEVNVRDDRGWSPLMFAAYSEAMPAGIVRMLLAKGADPTATGAGESPQSLAARRGHSEVARLLGVPQGEQVSRASLSSGPAASGGRPISEAVRKAVFLLESQSPTFVKRGGCNSCHNQSIPAAALALARYRGIPAPAKLTEVSLEMAERSPERTMNMAVISVNSVTYEAFGYIGTHRPADEYTDAMVHYLKGMQRPEGYWQTTGNRPPLTFDHFITTAMAINTLRVYSPPAQKVDTARRLARAAAWLEAASPTTTQERAFHLLGMHWSNASAAVIERAARELAKTQRSEGGWAQLPTMTSDAYATGEALYALHLAGRIRTDDPVFQKGVRYLLRTQASDGSWHVKTRSRPFQPYFDSGFPYGHDQWISAAGTSWSAMALSLAAESVSLSRR